MQPAEDMHRFFYFSMFLGLLHNILCSVKSSSRPRDEKQSQYSKFNALRKFA